MPMTTPAVRVFLKTHKRGEIYAHAYRDLDHLPANSEAFIDRYYNRTQLHSAQCYRPTEKLEHTTTLGIDVAKNVFQLHGVDARGRAVLSRRVKRDQLLSTVASLPPCVIGMEACGSAQHWGRAFELLGHTVKLMHPKYVRPYVK